MRTRKRNEATSTTKTTSTATAAAITQVKETDQAPGNAEAVEGETWPTNGKPVFVPLWGPREHGQPKPEDLPGEGIPAKGAGEPVHEPGLLPFLKSLSEKGKRIQEAEFQARKLEILGDAVKALASTVDALMHAPDFDQDAADLFGDMVSLAKEIKPTADAALKMMDTNAPTK